MASEQSSASSIVGGLYSGESNQGIPLPKVVSGEYHCPIPGCRTVKGFIRIQDYLAHQLKPGVHDSSELLATTEIPTPAVIEGLFYCPTYQCIERPGFSTTKQYQAHFRTAVVHRSSWQPTYEDVPVLPELGSFLRAALIQEVAGGGEPTSMPKANLEEPVQQPRSEPSSPLEATSPLEPASPVELPSPAISSIPKARFKNGDGRWYCPSSKCPKRKGFPSNASYLKHMQRNLVHKDEPFSRRVFCSELGCEASYEKPSDLLEHRQIVHWKISKPMKFVPWSPSAGLG